MTRAIYEPSGRAREYAPLACNLYRGCTHGCRYCWAPDMLRMKQEQFHGACLPRTGILAALEDDAAKMEFDERRVLLCFTTDPYQPAEMTHGLTRQAIEILHSHGIKVEILTKGGIVACRDFSLLGPDDRVATSLTFLYEKDSYHWEPNAATPMERIEFLRQAKERGLTTWVSLEPVIDTEQTLRLIDKAAPYTDEFKLGKLNHMRAAELTDWREFGYKAVEVLDKLGAKYYIKNDLAKEMDI